MRNPVRTDAWTVWSGRSRSIWSVSAFVALLLLSVCGPTLWSAAPAAGAEQPGDQADAGLVDRILTAQQALEHMQGAVLHSATTLEGDEGKPAKPVLQRAKVFLQAPNKYHLMMIPLYNGEEEEFREWFNSDGKTYTHAEREAPGDPVDVIKTLDLTKAGQDDVGLGDFIQLFRLQRKELEQRFRFAAEALPEADRKLPQARYRLRLHPLQAKLQKHIKEVELQLDEKFRTVTVKVRHSTPHLTELTVEKADYESALPDGVFDWKP